MFTKKVQGASLSQVAVGYRGFILLLVLAKDNIVNTVILVILNEKKL